MLIQFAGTRALGKAMGETGKQIETMGAQEMDEGAVRIAVSEAAAQRSRQLAEESGKLARRGVDELVTAEVAAGAGRMAVESGATDMAEGAAKMGAGTTMAGVGEALEERSEK